MKRSKLASFKEDAKDFAVGIVCLLGVPIGFSALAGLCLGSLFWVCRFVVTVLDRLIGV